jgi:hypothetical protein
MKLFRAFVLSAAAAGTLALMLAAAPARADFEVAGPDGRRILLKDDGTWRYLDDKPVAAAEPAASAASEPAADAPPPPTAELGVVRKTDTSAGCQFDLRLSNTLPFQVRSLVPEFAAVRPSGVTYSTQMTAFIRVKPGDAQTRSVRFAGIPCGEIELLRVQGGDRCEVGDLERFTPEKGVCLARLKLVPTDLVRFEK